MYIYHDGVDRIPTFYEILRENVINALIDCRDEDFPDFLTHIRKKAKLSRREVEEITHIDKKQLFKWEHGDFCKRPSSELLLHLADLYAIPLVVLDSKVDSFLYGEY